MIAVCRVEDLPSGGSARVDDTCTHQDASLADGWLEGCWIECPLHASRFDLRTGAVSGPPAKVPLRTYEVTVENGTVYVLPRAT